MTPTNQTAQQQAARAAAAEQMAAKAAVQASMAHPAVRPRKYPAYNTIIVIGVIVAALGSFLVLVWRS